MSSRALRFASSRRPRSHTAHVNSICGSVNTSASCLDPKNCDTQREQAGQTRCWQETPSPRRNAKHPSRCWWWVALYSLRRARRASDGSSAHSNSCLKERRATRPDHCVSLFVSELVQPVTQREFPSDRQWKKKKKCVTKLWMTDVQRNGATGTGEPVCMMWARGGQFNVKLNLHQTRQIYHY